MAWHSRISKQETFRSHCQSMEAPQTLLHRHLANLQPYFWYSGTGQQRQLLCIWLQTT